MTILFFLIALGILIFVHEFGHFVLAKRQGVKVEEFAFGFGPRLVGIKRGDTDYRVNALPLGGYVRMLGDDPQDEKASSDPRAFAKKGVWQRVKIIIFGPLMNLIFSLVVMPLVFFIGRSQPAFLREAPVVVGVVAGSPAASMDLKKGDLIVKIDGDNVSNWDDVINKIIFSPGNQLKLTIKRDSKILEEDVKVAGADDVRGGYVGIEPTFILSDDIVIGGVAKGGVADKAGIKLADRVIEMNNLPVNNWIEFTRKINETEGKQTTLKIKRGEEIFAVNVTPVFDEKFGRWRIGVVQGQPDIPMEVVRLGVVDSIVKGTKENIKLLSLTFEVFGRLVTGNLSYKMLGGPVLIASVSAAAAAAGVSSFLFFLAFLSLQLSIINLFPIPVLDGGHLLFLAIEAIRKKPVSVKIQQYATQAGFFFLVAFMLFVTWNDLDNMFGLRSLIQKLL